MKQNQKGITTIILALVVVGIVGVVGFFVFQNNHLWLRPAETDQSSALHSTVPDKWKTFTHTLGYSFQYPPNLEAFLLNNSDTVVIRSTENVVVGQDHEFDSTIFVLTNDDRLPLKEFIEKKEGVVNGRIPSTTEYFGTPLFREIIAFEQKLVGGKPGYFFRADPCSICRGETYSTYLQLSPNTVLNFDIFVDKETGNTESYKLYDRILSTFRYGN